MRSGAQAPSREQAHGLRLRLLRQSHLPAGRNHLREIHHALTTWFYAMYLMSSTRYGISAKQIQRETGVTYKTAWRMFQADSLYAESEDVRPIGGFEPRSRWTKPTSADAQPE